MLGPVALILLGYNYLFHFPQQQELTEVNEKLTKLSEADGDVRHRFGHVQADLAKAKRTQQDLKTELSTAESSLNDIKTRRASMLADLQTYNRPAETIDTIFMIFERNRLLVIESTAAAAGSLNPKSLTPIFELLAAETPSSSTFRTRSVDQSEQVRTSYEIHLEGSFDDVRTALREIVDRMPSVLPLGVELDTVELDSPRRHWILTLLV
jgi:septal ring factor EnvC (AmiA/AmiB activator)